MSNKTILAIDTATENCSVALSKGDQIFLKSEVAPQKHANLVLPMVDELLKNNDVSRSDIEAIGFGAGPGSFTGVRIAVSTAQALALGLDVKVFGVSDLKLLVAPKMMAKAQDSSSPIYGLACSDARMGEVYYALYSIENNKSVTIIEEKVAKPEQALEDIKSHQEAAAFLKDAKDSNLVCAGTGIAILLNHGLKDLISEEVANGLEKAIESNTLDLYPVADAIIKCAQLDGMDLVDPALAEPLYCRNEVTWKKVGEQ